MEILLIIFVLGVITAVVANNKGRSAFGWGVFGAVLFIIALPMLLFLKPLEAKFTENQAHDRGLKKCPACAEYVKYEAKICKHCKTAMVYSPASKRASG